MRSYTTASYPCPPPVRDQQGNVSNGLSRKQTAIRHNAHDAYYDRIHSTHNRVISKYGCLEKLQCKRESTHTPVDTPPPTQPRAGSPTRAIGADGVTGLLHPPLPPTLTRTTPEHFPSGSGALWSQRIPVALVATVVSVTCCVLLSHGDASPLHTGEASVAEAL